MNKLTKALLIIVTSFAFTNYASAFEFSAGVAGNLQVYAGKGVEHNGGTTGHNLQEANGAFDSSHVAVFLEGNVTDTVTIGLEYVPEAIESPENINAQQTGATDANPSGGTVVTNKASVEYEDITTLYANINLPVVEGSYLKLGYVSMDVITTESLGTGGSYNDVDLDGILVGAGYKRMGDNGMFVAVELTVADMDDVEATNTTDSTKKVQVNDIYGATASLRIGKTF